MTLGKLLACSVGCGCLSTGNAGAQGVVVCVRVSVPL